MAMTIIIESVLMIYLWFVIGWLGAVLMWYLMNGISLHPKTCPSPLGIMTCLVMGVGGPILLFIAIISWTIIHAEDVYEKLKNKNTWLTRPVCKRKSESE